MFRIYAVGAVAASASLFMVFGAHAQAAAPSDPALGPLISLFASQPWAIYVVLAAAALPHLVALLPQAAAGSGWAPIRKLLDALAGNYGNAANAALASPLLATALARPMPQAIFGAEHAAQLALAAFEAGRAAAPAPGPTVKAAASDLAPAANAALPPGGTSPIAALLGHFALWPLLALGLTGCGAAQIATVASALGLSTQAVNAANTAVADGQLFCSVASASGPIVTAIINAADKSAVTVINQKAKDVAAICSVIGGIPVSPPAVPSAAPVTAVVVPTA